MKVGDPCPMESLGRETCIGEECGIYPCSYWLTDNGEIIAMSRETAKRNFEDLMRFQYGNDEESEEAFKRLKGGLKR